MNRRQHVALAVAAGLTAFGLAGCGTAQATSAADDIPALSASLEKVDDAMAARRFPAAERLLRQLVADVRKYQAAGDLDADAASDIVDAARRLLAELAGRDAPASESTGTVTDGQDDGGKDGSTPHPDKKPKGDKLDEATPGPKSSPTPEPTDQAIPEPSDPATPADPASSASAEPATDVSPTAPAAAPVAPASP